MVLAGEMRPDPPSRSEVIERVRVSSNVEEILSAMDTYGESREVQEEGCNTLANLASRGDAVQKVTIRHRFVFPVPGKDGKWYRSRCA